MVLWCVYTNIYLAKIPLPPIPSGMSSNTANDDTILEEVVEPSRAVESIETVTATQPGPTESMQSTPIQGIEAPPRAILSEAQIHKTMMRSLFKNPQWVKTMKDLGEALDEGLVIQQYREWIEDCEGLMRSFSEEANEAYNCNNTSDTQQNKLVYKGCQFYHAVITKIEYERKRQNINLKRMEDGAYMVSTFNSMYDSFVKEFEQEREAVAEAERN